MEAPRNSLHIDELKSQIMLHVINPLRARTENTTIQFQFSEQFTKGQTRCLLELYLCITNVVVQDTQFVEKHILDMLRVVDPLCWIVQSWRDASSQFMASDTGYKHDVHMLVRFLPLFPPYVFE